VHERLQEVQRSDHVDAIDRSGIGVPWKRDRGKVHDMIGPRARDGVAHLRGVGQLRANAVIGPTLVPDELVDDKTLRAQASAEMTAREAIRAGDEDPRS
jgi:hypothetical protein